MTDIRYVCLSDLHFGAKSSILTPLDGDHVDDVNPSIVLTALFDALETLTRENTAGELPTLVLLGDVLDLALSGSHDAAIVFDQFVERVLARGSRMFAPKIYYVPGNHDHHLWELVRDQRWHASIATSDADDVLAPVVHSSPLGGFSDETADRQTMEGQLLALLIRRHAGCDDVQVVTAYPNLGLKAEHGARVAVLHHGHFVEGTYRIISTFKGVLFPDHEPPTEVHGWEAENHAWIDFVWGTLGQSGKAGVDITRVYEMLAREDSLELLVERAASALAHDSGPHTDFLHKAGGWFARTVGGHIVQAIQDRERHQVKVALSKKGWEGLNEYVDGPVRLQLAADPDPGFHLHDDLVFIFGHTHKPFEEIRLPATVGQSVEVVNTGGWVVDSVADDSVQGAAVVVLDEQLNAVSLRCYHEGSSNNEGVRVSGAQSSAFRDRIQGLVDANAAEWAKLSAAALQAVAERHADLSVRVTEDMKPEDAQVSSVAGSTSGN